MGQAPAAWMILNTFIGIAQQFPWEDNRVGHARHRRHRPPRARRRRRGHRAVERPAVRDDAEARAGAVVGLHDRAQARAGDPARLVPDGRAPRGGRHPEGRRLDPARRAARSASTSCATRGIDKVAFTGSTAAGRRIASICGEQLKRVSLELGGKSAAIILDDADLAATVEGLKMASLMNNGQACVAQTRILASRSRYDEVVDAVAAMVGGLEVGDPADATTEIGPLVAKRQQERVEKYIALGQEEGARLAVGGNGLPPGIDRGWYVQPTVFANATTTCASPARRSSGRSSPSSPTTTCATRSGSRTTASTAWPDRCGPPTSSRASTSPAACGPGTYAVNQYTMDFMAPFGGYKASGIGREFGKEGLEHYLELKTIIPPGGGITAAG